MSPTLELQGGITVRLKASSAVIDLVGTRVYDHVPRAPDGAVTALFPFVAHSASDELQNDADCIEAVDVAYEIEAWSDKPGYVEVLRIADAIKRSLHRYEMTLSTNALVELNHVQTRKFRDPDGVTSHVILEFAATIETPLSPDSPA
jgi:hypothetical protein